MNHLIIALAIWFVCGIVEKAIERSTDKMIDDFVREQHELNKTK